MNHAELLKAVRANIVQEIREKTPELHADLDAVDRLIARNIGSTVRASDGEVVRITARPRFNTSAALANGKVNLASLVREAIAAVNGEAFTKNSIVEWLGKHHPLVEPNHPTISAQLWHMQKSGLLETVRERAGNKPAMYKATEKGRVYNSI
jgi:hypothetical protein